MAVRPGPQTPPIYNGFAEMTVPWSGGFAVMRLDEISSAVLLQKLDLDEITAVLCTRRLRWYGHVQRATSCINSITWLGLPGTRDHGRPRKTWSACVRNNLDGVNPLDRNSWRTSVRHCQVLPTRSPGQPQHCKYQNRIWWYILVLDTKSPLLGCYLKSQSGKRLSWASKNPTFLA